MHTHSHPHALVFSSPVILRSNGRVRNSDVKSGVVGGQLLFEDGHVAPKTCQQLREIPALQDGCFCPVDGQIILSLVKLAVRLCFLFNYM